MGKEFEIWRLNPQSSEAVRRQFCGMRTLESVLGVGFDPSLYVLVYKGTVPDKASLDDIYEMLNVNHPKNFHAASLSVSDVVVLDGEEAKEAFFVDTVGFVLVPEFMQGKNGSFWSEMVENLPKAPTEKSAIWVNDVDEILCKSEETSNAIADLLKACGYNSITGYYDRLSFAEWKALRTKMLRESMQQWNGKALETFPNPLTKEYYRQKAIEWQASLADKATSYGELATDSSFWELIGTRYGLTEEFRENGII